MASFICPDCGQPTLTIDELLSLPPDSRSDEIDIQLVQCNACGMKGVAIYQESRRGSLDSEHVDHRGYRLLSPQYQALRRQITKCSQRRNPRCECYTHVTLGRKNSQGRWEGIAGLDWRQMFTVELA